MKNKMNINTFIAEYAIIIIFIVLFAAMSIFAPNFLTGSNIANVLRQVSINGICAIGMTFVIPDRGYRPIGRGYHWGKRRPDSNDDDKQC